MTKISYIHGIPADELAGRGLEAPAQAAYIPYTQLTEGEMRLALLREQAAVYAAAYPEVPAFRRAVRMYDGALIQGIHNGGVHFVGAIDADLQNVARQINQAKRLQRPAAGAFYTPRPSNGIGRIGEIVPPSITEDCEDYATRMTNRYYGGSDTAGPLKFQYKAMLALLPAKKKWLEYLGKCETQKAIEALYNAKLEGASHHVLYHRVSDVYRPIIGTRVDVKRILHQAGVGALAYTGDMSSSLMSMWVETGILRSNATGGVGAVGSVETSFALSDDPEAAYIAYQKTVAAAQKNRIGAAQIPVAAVIALVTAALTVADTILKTASAKKAGAFASANGFGTEAYSAAKTDWTNVQTPETITTDTNGNLLPVLLIGAGAYLLAK